MDSLANTAVVILGVMCLSRFVVGPEYSGPFHIIDRLRRFVGMEYDEYSNLRGRNVLAQGLSCMVCAPVWIGVIVAPFFYFLPDVTAVVLFPFAVSELVWRFNYG